METVRDDSKSCNHMSEKKLCYINVSQMPMNRQARSAMVIFATLMLGSLAVGFRVYLCQAQAYAMIALSIFSVCIFLVHKSQRNESVVKIMRGVYCSELAQTSQIAVIPGRMSVEVASSYERLHFTRVRVWIPLFVWLAWVAYGSLFHSGRHSEHVVHELLVDLAAVGEGVPALVQRFRVYALVLCGFASIAATNLARYRQDSRERDSQGVIWVVFLVSLFLPAIDSTAQALVPAKLAARTAFFFVLFLLSESFNRLVHYELWLANYRETTRAILIAVQIALGRAKPMKLNRDMVGDVSKQIDSLSSSTSTESSGSDLMKSKVVKYNCVLQSAWLLVASDVAYPFAFLQVLLILALHVHIRRRILANIAEKQSGYLCVNHGQTSVLPVTARNNLDEPLLASTNDPANDDERKCQPALENRRQSRSQTPAPVENVAHRQRTSPPPPQTPPIEQALSSPGSTVRRKSASPSTRAPVATETTVLETPTADVRPPVMLSEREARRRALLMLQPQTKETVANSN